MKQDPAVLEARLTDPRWQWKKRSRKGCVARLRAWGVRINEARIQAHYDLVASQAQKITPDTGAVRRHGRQTTTTS